MSQAKSKIEKIKGNTPLVYAENREKVSQQRERERERK